MVSNCKQLWKNLQEKREPGFYPTSLTKLLLGDYGHPVSPSLQWGINHEDETIALYHKMTGVVYIHVVLLLI